MGIIINLYGLDGLLNHLPGDLQGSVKPSHLTTEKSSSGFGLQAGGCQVRRP